MSTIKSTTENTETRGWNVDRKKVNEGERERNRNEWKSEEEKGTLDSSKCSIAINFQ